LSSLSLRIMFRSLSPAHKLLVSLLLKCRLRYREAENGAF
jgi:hypothetical protein